MTEPIMYLGIGFLVAALIGMVVIPLIHDRAVRLTVRRLESAIPLSMVEMQADKDQLRAEFAMATRRLEINVEQLRNKAASQFAELGKEGDAINRLMTERDAQKIEIIALKSQVKTLKAQLTAAENEVKSDGDIVSIVPHEQSPTKLASRPANLVPKERPVAGFAMSTDLENSLLPKERATVQTGEPSLDPDSRPSSFDQRISIGREGSDFSVGLQAPEPSIRVSPGDHFVSNEPLTKRRMFQALIQFFIAVLIGIGVSIAWHYW